METSQQFMTLQEKIESLGSAIFMNYSEAVLKLPSSVITSARVDEYGYIWFYAPKKNEELQVADQGFPLRLDFFRKGMDYFVQLEGTGWIVTDPEEIVYYQTSFSATPPADKCQVLVKVKMEQVQYRETKKEIAANWRQLLRSYLSWPVSTFLHKKPGYYA